MKSKKKASSFLRALKKEAPLTPGYIALTAWSILTILIIGWMFCASLSTTPEIFSGKVGTFSSGLHFENYAKAWSSQNVSKIFMNSLGYTLVSCTALIFVCAPAAYALSRFKFFACKFIQSGLVSAMAVPVAMIILPLFGGCALEYPTEQEERAHFTKLLATFPVSGAQIVTAKYILGLCYAAVCNLLALMCAMAQVYIHHTVSLSEALRIWGIGISVSLIFLSLIYVGYFLLGRRWGTVFFIGVTCLIAVIYGVSSALVGIEAIFRLSPVLVACLLFAGAVMLVLSRFVSVRIYKWKNS